MLTLEEKAALTAGEDKQYTLPFVGLHPGATPVVTKFVSGVRPMTLHTAGLCGYPTLRAGVRKQSCRTTSNP
jgi:hypothetical protein